MFCISISYRTAPMHVRELYAFSDEEKLAFEERVLFNQQVQGCVVISTCNRSEIYFSGDKNTIPFIEQAAADFKHMDLNEMKKYFLIYSKEGALRHLFQVSSGLDSMVLGEDEILRQVKDAYQLSLKNKNTGIELNIVFQNAFNNAKLIKTTTKLSNTPVSIGTITANRIFDYVKNIDMPTILVVGATGKMGSIVVKNLCSKNNLNVIGTSRKHYKSSDIYASNANYKIVDYKDRYQYLKAADVIVSATTSPHYTFTSQEVVQALGEGNHPKLFIDLAVPSDIDRSILSIDGIELIDIDYFEKASSENNLLKLNEVDKAELILDSCIDETLKNIYFQEFYGNIDLIVSKINDKGFPYILYQLKEKLNSEQLKVLLDSLQDMIEVNSLTSEL